LQALTCPILDALEAFLLTFLYLPLLFLGLDDLIPKNSRLGRRMNRSLDEKETSE